MDDSVDGMDKVTMDIDSETDLNKEIITVYGEVFHFNKGAAFFRFSHNNDRNAEICLFRPNKLYVDGQKLGASHFKSVSTIGNILAIGDIVHGMVVPYKEAKSYALDGMEGEITPEWYAHHVWKGDKPNSIDTQQVNVNDDSKIKVDHQEITIDDVAGKIVHNKMAINARGGANQTFISFINPDGKQDLAMFRNPRYFYIDGERAKVELLKKWPVGQV